MHSCRISNYIVNRGQATSPRTPEGGSPHRQVRGSFYPDGWLECKCTHRPVAEHVVFGEKIACLSKKSAEMRNNTLADDTDSMLAKTYREPRRPPIASDLGDYRYHDE